MPRQGRNHRISDIQMPNLNGVEVLKAAKKQDEAIEVIMVTGHASVETAAEALRLGAFDYLFKPFDDIEKVRNSVVSALARHDLKQSNKQLLGKLTSINQRLVQYIQTSENKISTGATELRKDLEEIKTSYLMLQKGFEELKNNMNP